MVRTAGIVVGRFQVPELHQGHKMLLHHVLAENDQMMVLVGTQKHIDADNPLWYVHRKEMIEDEFKNIIVVELPDIRYVDNPKLGDVHWSNSIDKICTTVFPSSRCTLYGGRDSFLNYYYGTTRTKEINFKHFHEEWSGTYQRRSVMGKALMEDNGYDGASFRAGIIFGVIKTLGRKIW